MARAIKDSSTKTQPAGPRAPWGKRIERGRCRLTQRLGFESRGKDRGGWSVPQGLEKMTRNEAKARAESLGAKVARLGPRDRSRRRRSRRGLKSSAEAEKARRENYFRR